MLNFVSHFMLKRHLFSIYKVHNKTWNLFFVLFPKTQCEKNNRRIATKKRNERTSIHNFPYKNNGFQTFVFGTRGLTRWNIFIIYKLQ